MDLLKLVLVVGFGGSVAVAATCPDGVSPTAPPVEKVQDIVREKVFEGGWEHKDVIRYVDTRYRVACYGRSGDSAMACVALPLATAEAKP